MEEMLEDTLDMEEDEELEEEADAEVDKVLFDLTDGKLGQVGTIKDELPVRFVFLEACNVVTDDADCDGRPWRSRFRGRRRRGTWRNIGSS
jgi:hypothetical protein